MPFTFVVNLRSETARADTRSIWEPKGWLLAPDYATHGLRVVARNAFDEGLVVVVDNGNFSLIERAADRIGRAAAAAQSASDLRSLLRVDANEAIVAEPARLRLQLDLAATRLVGAENIGPAITSKLYRPDAYNRKDLRTINRQVARRAVRERDTLPPGRTYLPVASARDYRTAHDAGAAFARAGLTAAAIGFGAAMTNRTDTDRTDIFGTPTTLARPLPARYLRAGEIARGFLDGFRQTAGSHPTDFHFLGLGAPIMLALGGLFGHGITTLTADATSPIKDAFAGSVYVSKPSLLKVDTIREAARIVRYRTARWRCTCRYCRWYTDRYPFDLPGARSWAMRSGRPPVDDDLGRGGGLAASLPLLAHLTSGTQAAHTRLARIGHNHIQLQRITEAVNRRRERQDLVTWLAATVSRYQRAARTDKYGEAVHRVFEWASAPL